jgi:hypothetical protein
MNTQLVRPLTLDEACKLSPITLGGPYWKPPTAKAIRAIKVKALASTMAQTAVPFPHTLGVELTWVPPFPLDAYGYARSTGEYYSSEYREQMLEALRAGTVRTWSRDTDCGCVEIATNPCSDYTEFSSVAYYYDRIMRCVGFSNTAPEFCVGGGAHIHVGSEKLGHTFTEYAAWDMYHRPYITRAFSYYADDENCAPLEKPQNRAARFGDIDVSGKSNVLRRTHYGHSGTLEFRCFQAPNNVREHELYIAFVVAYVSYVEGKMKAQDKTAPKYVKRDNPADQWQYDQRRFVELITELGLPVKRYRKYLRNIEHRAWFASQLKNFSY